MLTKIIRCSKEEYLHWLFHSRQIMLLVLWVFTDIYAVEPLKVRAAQMNTQVHILEPFTAAGNSGTVLLILPIMFLIFMQNYPMIRGNAVFRIYRIGRSKWFVSEVLTLCFCILTFLLAVGIGTVLPVLGRCSFSGQWSLAVTEYAQRFPEQAGNFDLLPENLFYQIRNPYIAAFHTYALLALYLMLIGMIQLYSTVLHLRRAGTAASALMILASAGLCAVRTAWMWMFPMAHSIIWLHYTQFLRHPVLSLAVSYLYLSGFCMLLGFGAFLQARRWSFHSMEGME